MKNKLIVLINAVFFVLFGFFMFKDAKFRVINTFLKKIFIIIRYKMFLQCYFF